MKSFGTFNEAAEYCESQGAFFHHSSSEKGYRSTCRYKQNPEPYGVVEYNGRYGKGYKILGYNNDRNICDGFMSNRYYKVWYLTFDNKHNL